MRLKIEEEDETESIPKKSISKKAVEKKTEQLFEEHQSQSLKKKKEEIEEIEEPKIIKKPKKETNKETNIPFSMALVEEIVKKTIDTSAKEKSKEIDLLDLDVLNRFCENLLTRRKYLINKEGENASKTLYLQGQKLITKLKKILNVT